MWLRWFPWRLLVSRAARARGLIDPVKVLTRLESFAQPLEGKIPLELIRAGLVFHARGLLNTGAIQHNLDWIWPYWVERQYDPADDAFIPRAFSITHVNLTHRNWTAIGVPDRDTLPIVDPRGLVTPFWDGWSLDGWIVARDGRRLVPSKLEDAGQHLEMGGGIAVVTRSACDGMELLSRASVRERDGSAECVLSLRARSESDACLVVALRTLVLHSPGEVYPGPYTYKRFWFRDAAFILHALLCLGLAERVERVLDTFPRRQTATGLYHSQEGEWDSNGEALWVLRRYCELAGRAPKPEWRRSIERGARWIRRNRLPEGEELHSGLLPPGFSAEHLGPNDYYFWDDFWGIAGLHAASRLLPPAGGDAGLSTFREEAERFREAVEKSLSRVALRLGRPAMPASSYRRLDSGAVGSLAAGYPLQIFAPRDERLLDTAEFLLSRCLVNGGFYQDIIHSGVNPYLTLQIAQVLLRAGDGRFQGLVRTVADLASPTGQWPEAVHPRTGGGCMGDGHHAWASAEWVLMVRNMFVREEGERLVLASGILPEWLEADVPISLGPAPTSFGEVRVEILPRGRRMEVRWSGSWRGAPPRVEVRLPGFAPVDAPAGQESALLDRISHQGS